MKKAIFFALLICCALLPAACGTEERTDQHPAPGAPETPPPASNKVLFCAPDFRFPYHLSEPARRFELDPELREISGLAWNTDQLLSCVQDERGTIFGFDLRSGKIRDTTRFGKPGDYEGLDFVGDRAYVVRSDGRLFRFLEGSPLVEYRLPVPEDADLEGLAYQPEYARLLLACKGSPGNSEALKGKRVILGFDLKTEKLQPEPAYVIDPEQLGQKQDSSRRAKFRPSGVAVHPGSGDVYVIAHKGKKLLVLSAGGEMKYVARLDREQLPQPEGICFAPDGTLYLASEGDGKAGRILEFRAH